MPSNVETLQAEHELLVRIAIFSVRVLQNKWSSTEALDLVIRDILHTSRESGLWDGNWTSNW
jgi:hypothetical protein